MANYPTSIPSFTNKSAGQTIASAHINSLQDEVVAIGSGLLQGTAPLNSSNSTVVRLSVTGDLSVIGGSTLSGPLALPGTITPAALSSGNTNNYNPAGLTGVFALRLSGAAGGSTLTGLHINYNGELKLLINAGAPTIGIAHNSGGSSADAKFVLQSGSDTVIGNNQSILFWADPVSNFWRQIS